MFNRFNSIWFCLIGLLAFATPAQSQQPPAKKSWQAVAHISQNRPASHAWVRPQKFHAFNLDRAALQTELAGVPKEFSAEARAAQKEISLPMPDGSVARFTVAESPVMAPELAAKFPEIKTYVGQGIDDPLATVRFDMTPAGFHGQILSPKGAVYIDPYWRGDAVLHASYYKRDYQKEADAFRCLVQNDDEGAEPQARNASKELPRSGTHLRTYRLACAATAEYVTHHSLPNPPNVAAGLAGIVTTVNRVSGIYETELAIRMVLVAENNLIVYTNSTGDPYSNITDGNSLTVNQTNLDFVVGSADYDIGHLFNTDDNGLAGVGVVCQGGLKARGATGLPTPKGDAFDVDYVAHEIGHQFGGLHTFNSTSAGGCTAVTRSPSSAYEPGSGTTIQAYAGICGSDNVQTNSDPYFHSRSFDEMIAYSTTGLGNCPTPISTGNTAPTVSAGANCTIPRSTPFTLTASGSDANGDTLTYCWEERDLGPAQALSEADNGSSPLFRSFNPTTSPSRTFPRLSNILSNITVLGERLPTTSRTMNFRVTARDNRAGGGGVNTADMTVTVDSASGPFIITSPNTATNWSGIRTVTWNVAGTTGAPVSAANVNILLSTNGGTNFQFALSSNTPNDGSEAVLLPNVTSSSARIKVEGAGNIFFDISNTNFSVLPAPGPVVVLDSTALALENCAPTNNRVDPGETVSVNFRLKNNGSANTTNLVVTLLANSGVVSPSSAQSYGVLTAGGSAVGKTFSFTANGTCGGTIQAVLQLQDGSTNMGTLTNSFTLGSVTVSKTNITSITIADFGSASPYPSTNIISGATDTVTKVTVSLLGLHHSYPGDLDILLAAPNGQAVVLVSSVGGGSDITNVNLTFDDSAAGSLPQLSQIFSGTYLPTSYYPTQFFPDPAPAAPYGATLASLNGIDPNGVWSLFIFDAVGGDDGGINGGWKLTVTYGELECCSDSTPPDVSSVTRSGNNVTLNWSAISGRTYRVQYKNDLNDSSWTNLAGDVLAGGTTASKVDNTATPAKRFYQIILLD